MSLALEELTITISSPENKPIVATFY